MEQTFTLDPNYCYTVKELAFLWNKSHESIRRMFVNEPGTWSFGCRRPVGGISERLDTGEGAGRRE
jgi:hypothetical protein